MKTKQHGRRSEKAAGVSSVKSSKSVLARGLIRCKKLQEKVHAVFGGQLFLADEPPTSRTNRQRFSVYLEMLWSITELKFKLIQEFMRVNGVGTSEPHQICNLQRAIAAMTELQSRGHECVQKKTSSAKRSH